MKKSVLVQLELLQKIWYWGKRSGHTDMIVLLLFLVARFGVYYLILDCC